MSRSVKDYSLLGTRLGWFQRIVFGYVALTFGIILWGLGLLLVYYFIYEVFRFDGDHLAPILVLVFFHVGLPIVATVGLYILFKSLYLKWRHKRSHAPVN